MAKYAMAPAPAIEIRTQRRAERTLFMGAKLRPRTRVVTPPGAPNRHRSECRSRAARRIAVFVGEILRFPPGDTYFSAMPKSSLRLLVLAVAALSGCGGPKPVVDTPAT